MGNQLIIKLTNRYNDLGIVEYDVIVTDDNGNGTVIDHQILRPDHKVERMYDLEQLKLMKGGIKNE